MSVEEKKVERVAETTAVAVAGATWAQTRIILRVIVIILLVAGTLWLFYALESVILLVVLAIFFAYLIAPLVEFVRRPFIIRGRSRVMPRGIAIGVVYLIIFGSLGTIIFLLLPKIGDQITQLAQQAPGYWTSARSRAQGLNDFYQRNQIPAGARDAISKAVNRLIDTASEYATSGIAVTFGWLGYIPWLVLIPILAFFLLKDADSFRRSALQMLPRGRWRWRGDEFFQDVNSTLAAYIRAQLTACVIVGGICTLGFSILGVPYSLVLGILAGMLEFIPLVGPLTLFVIVVFITGFHSVGHAITVAVFLGVLRVVEDYTIYPRIIGQGIHLHPLAVILAILCGAELAGVAGIFLAIPVVAILSVSFRHWLEHRGIEDLGELFENTEEKVKDAEDAVAQVAEAMERHEEHLTDRSTPEDMARARPDLITGELKNPGTS
ncbi:MAG TPA: AI-2E family transporter [Pyrinomonadaceae bacterium]|nr:AI-2E family transporter [Pyrinomonadaceae bacterium]